MLMLLVVVVVVVVVVVLLVVAPRRGRRPCTKEASQESKQASRLAALRLGQ